MTTVDRIIIGSGIICEVEGSDVKCKVSDTGTMRNEAKYWLNEHKILIDENNITEVIQAMDAAGDRRAEELERE